MLNAEIAPMFIVDAEFGPICVVDAVYPFLKGKFGQNQPKL